MEFQSDEYDVLDLGCILLLFRSTSTLYILVRNWTNAFRNRVRFADRIKPFHPYVCDFERDAACVSGHMYGRSPISLNCSVCSV